LGPTVLWVSMISMVLCLSALTRRIARDGMWFRQPVMLVGDSGDVDRVLRRVLRHPEFGLDPIVAIRTRRRSLTIERTGPRGFEEIASLSGSQARLTARQVKDLVAAAGIGRVIVTGWSQSMSERTELIRILAQSDVCVDYVSGEPEALLSTAVLHHIEGLPMLTINLRTTRITRSLKRVFDLVAATAGLVVLSPLVACAALRIKLESRGPALFKQPRTGINGVPFELLKLRTMVDGADGMREQVRAQAGSGRLKMLKLHDDPRVTKFGARLRRWSIDELPQLWNVIRGEMSLVGPRPLPLDESDHVEAHFAERVTMRPGITGPWQIHGRSDIPFDDMVKLDYLYVASWTMREDLRLLARTVGAVIRGRGAY
jgi:lipopolysaccharide/colanic/teichoic acid biosynthesis glycosyltransferase